MTEIVPAVEPAPTTAEPEGGETARTVRAGPFFERTDWLSFGITALMALGIYLWTLAPDVTLENAGGLAPAAMYGGVAYPPGMPAWTVYSWLFVKLLPFGTIAWRIGVGSAVAAALMSGLTALMVSRSGLMLMAGDGRFEAWKRGDQKRLRIVCGWVAGMAVALGAPIWRKAVIVDVWTFGDLLFTVILCLLMRWSVEPRRRRFLFGVMFVYGVSLTGNWEFVTLLPGILFTVTAFDPKLGRDLFLLLLIAWLPSMAWDDFDRPLPTPHYMATFNTPMLFAFIGITLAITISVIVCQNFRSTGSNWWPALRCVIAIALGLLACFWLPIASMTNPPMNWAYPRTVAGFFHSLGRGQYDNIHPAEDPIRMAQVIWWQFLDAGGGLGWMYMMLATVPFIGLLRMNGATKRWALSLAAVFMCAGPLLITTLNYWNDKTEMYLVRPYFGPMYVVLGILSGLGLVMSGGAMISLLERRRRIWRSESSRWSKGHPN